MEEKKEKKSVTIDCGMCRKCANCMQTKDKGVCSLFEPDVERIKEAALCYSQVEKDKTGMTWKEAETEALKGRCIRRVAWPRETFVWRRRQVMLTDRTNDPYIKEACKLTGYDNIPEGACLAKLDYDGRCKGLPRIILGWSPSDREDVVATDWVAFDVLMTYEDREVKVKDVPDTVKVIRLMKAIFPGSRSHIHMVRSKVSGDIARRIEEALSKYDLEEDLFNAPDERTRKIMKGLDDLLK